MQRRTCSVQGDVDGGKMMLIRDEWIDVDGWMDACGTDGMNRQVDKQHGTAQPDTRDRQIQTARSDGSERSEYETSARMHASFVSLFGESFP